MKRKILVGFAVIVALSFFTTGTCFADWFYSVNIVGISVDDTGTVITAADDVGNTLVQKYVDSTNQNTLLAVALTARSLPAKCHVFLDTGTDTITSLVIVAD